MTKLRKTPVLIALAGALALGACATATPYQPAGVNGQRGGYAEQRLEANRYAVSFSGNSVTSRDQVEMSLLLRSAELTVENGYDWFATVTRATDRDTRLETGLILIQASETYSETGFDCDAHVGKPDPSKPRPALEVGSPETPINAKHNALIRLHYIDGMDKDSCPAIV